MLKKFLFLCFMMMSIAGNLPAQTGKALEEPWEKAPNKRQPPEKVLDVLKVRPGMSVAEIGAGSGRYLVQVAKRMKNKGEIYANDIDKKALQHIMQRCREHHFTNVQIIAGDIFDPNLPKEELDLIYIISTYHHFSDPVRLLRNAVPALKPDGRLAIIESDPEKAPDKGWHATAAKTLEAQLAMAGYVLIKTEKFLPKDNIYIFKVIK